MFTWVVKKPHNPRTVGSLDQPEGHAERFGKKNKRRHLI
jgi:hypothetical protein